MLQVWRRFLDMATYLGKYVDGFSAMCKPLRQLTKEDVAWDWNFEQQTAFKKIKHGQQSATSCWVRGRYRYLLLLRKSTSRCDRDLG